MYIILQLRVGDEQILIIIFSIISENIAKYNINIFFPSILHLHMHAIRLIDTSYSLYFSERRNDKYFCRLNSPENLI